MITTHYYNSRGEVQADKDHLLEELDLTEEEAEIYHTCTPPSTIVTSVVSKKSGTSTTFSKKANTTSPNLIY